MMLRKPLSGDLAHRMEVQPSLSLSQEIMRYVRRSRDFPDPKGLRGKTSYKSGSSPHSGSENFGARL